MSGGHWDYDDATIITFAERLGCSRHDLAKEFGVDFVTPLVVALEACGRLLHDMDWQLSGDAYIEDPAARLQAFRDVLREALR